MYRGANATSANAPYTKADKRDISTCRNRADELELTSDTIQVLYDRRCVEGGRDGCGESG